MNVFADTSALFASVDTGDTNHHSAVQTWRALADQRAHIVCTNYVMLETITLLQKRLGLNAVRLLQEDIAPVLHVHWLSADDHAAALRALLTANRRQLSLVDCTSFDAMRRLDIRTAFTFDEHFSEQGFDCLRTMG